MASVPDAHAQSERLSIAVVRELVKPEGLTLPLLPALNSALATKRPTLSETLAASLQQQTPSQQCRRGRRASIGALIGAGAAAPLSSLVYRRFDNEGANGAAAAAATVALGTVAGAVVGLITCPWPKESPSHDAVAHELSAESNPTTRQLLRRR